MKAAPRVVIGSSPDSSEGESLANRVTFLGSQMSKNGRGGNGLQG